MLKQIKLCLRMNITILTINNKTLQMYYLLFKKEELTWLTQQVMKVLMNAINILKEGKVEGIKHTLIPNVIVNDINRWYMILK